MQFIDTQTVYRGQGWTELWHMFHAAWESITISVDRIEDLGERVLLLGTFHGIGLGSGVEVTRSTSWLQTVSESSVPSSPGGEILRMMSQKNVGIVRAAAAAYKRGDLDALTELYDPRVEFVTLLLGTHRGKKAIRSIPSARFSRRTGTTCPTTALTSTR